MAGKPRDALDQKCMDLAEGVLLRFERTRSLGLLHEDVYATLRLVVDELVLNYSQLAHDNGDLRMEVARLKHLLKGGAE